MKSPIVILHGWGLSGETFAPLVRECQKLGYRTFAPDLPGFGKSKLPDRPQSLDDYANFLRVYITTHNIKNPILIGHSFGGRVALYYQLKYPHHILALVLSGTPGFTPVARKKIQFFVILAKIGKLFFSVPPLSMFQDSVRKWFYYVAGARDFYRAQGVMRDTFKIIVLQELENAMKHVTVPTLLIWGELDTICPTFIAQKMHLVISSSTLQLIPSTTHALPFKEPKLFSKSVDEFLQHI